MKFKAFSLWFLCFFLASSFSPALSAEGQSQIIKDPHQDEALGTLPQTKAQQPRNDFVDNGDGTVTDRLSGLMWMKCSEGQAWDKQENTCSGEPQGYAWDDALNFVHIFNQGGGRYGHADWRVPTIKELATLVDYNRPVPIDEQMFPATPGRWFWSSTIFQRFPNRAWFVAFGYGDISTERVDNVGMFVRLVRDAR